MTRDELRRVVIEELIKLAPEIEPLEVSPRTRLREDLDLDSFDFVRLITALVERLGVDVPEADYRKLETLDGCLDYFSARMPAPAPEAHPTE